MSSEFFQPALSKKAKACRHSLHAICSVLIGLGVGVGVDTLEKKYIGDAELGTSAITISDIATAVSTLTAFLLISACLSKIYPVNPYQEQEDTLLTHASNHTPSYGVSS